MSTSLACPLRHARHFLAVAEHPRGIADHEHIRLRRQAQIRQHLDPASAVTVDRQITNQFRGLHTGGPEHSTRGELLAVTERHRLFADRGDALVGAHFNAKLL